MLKILLNISKYKCHSKINIETNVLLCKRKNFQYQGVFLWSKSFLQIDLSLVNHWILNN